MRTSTIHGVIEKGKLLTLTTDEALRTSIADFRADTARGGAAEAGHRQAPSCAAAAPNWAENVVRFLTNPVVSSMLITVGMLGMLTGDAHARLRHSRARSAWPASALFFWGHWLVQLAGWEELLLVACRRGAAGASRCS